MREPVAKKLMKFEVAMIVPADNSCETMTQCIQEKWFQGVPAGTRWPDFDIISVECLKEEGLNHE